MIIDALGRELALYDFAKECLEKLYKEDSCCAIADFEGQMAHFEDFGFISLKCVKRAIKEYRERRARNNANAKETAVE
jgi:hypothetical protein